MTAAPSVLLCEPNDLLDGARELTASGWTVRAGFDLPAEPWDLTARRWACHGIVRASTDAEAATWALVRGCGLIVAVTTDAPPHFLTDLARVGRLTRFRPDRQVLDANEAALLAALAEGQSMQQASARLFLSGRTAQRRLASARAALGVRTTREAVLAWIRLNRQEP